MDPAITPLIPPMVTTEHAPERLQTDKHYIYNMNIYGNFNGLLIDFLFSYSLIYCIGSFW